MSDYVCFVKPATQTAIKLRRNEDYLKQIDSAHRQRTSVLDQHGVDMTTLIVKYNA